ncbi:hypothetical protein DFH09DRAFT_598195 [Mycena vulgaris]|nr:hypothetical protein DFH09DRAFT_598195 [Mycena vulgaris]
MIQVLGAFLLLGPLLANAASLVPIPTTNFDSQTLLPPTSAAGQIVFNWHDGEDLGDHNAVDTQIFKLTDGGNMTLSDNSTGPYVIEAIGVQFNRTHFNQKASSTPWIAIFPCNTNSSAGNTSDLISNAQKLGAHAILAYTVDSSYSFCNLTDNTPAVTIPIYVTERWHGGFPVFSDQLADLFGPSRIKFYNATAMNRVEANITSDFNALRANSSSLAQTDVLLVRIPAISTNTSVVSGTSTSTSAPTKTPSSAVREHAQLAAVPFLLLSSSLLTGW